MKRNKFFLQLVLIFSAGLVFSGCLKNPDQGETGMKFFNTNDGSGKLVVTQSTPDDTNKFQTPLAEGVPNTQGDLIQIRNGLADRFDLKPEEVQITIESESSLNHATGYVNVGEGERGGIYFAVRQDGEWIIAYDGVDTLTCDMIEGYNFPAGMIPRCYDVNTGEMVDR